MSFPEILLVLGFAAMLLTLPGTVELLLLTLGGVLPPRRRSAPELTSDLKLAVVIPAHNEAAGIGMCLSSLRSSASDWDLVVVADNCSDNTALAARQAGARVIERFDNTRRGKGYALDFAFRELLREDYAAFLIIDADTTVAPNLLPEMRSVVASGAEAAQCAYLVRNVEDSLRTRLMGMALAAFNVLRPRGRDRLGLSAGILGNGFMLSRRTLEAVPYEAASVVEDLEYHLRLVRSGYKVRFVGSTAVFGDMPAEGEGVKTQRARWEGGRFLMLAEHAPRLLADVLRGRLRMLEPLLDLLLLPLAFHVALVCVALVGAGIPRAYGVAALALVGGHVLAAVLVRGGGSRELLTLAAAPFYVIWKLAMIPRILASSRRGTAWVRTERKAERP